MNPYRALFSLIWLLSEWSGIGLGPIALRRAQDATPWVFGEMIGRKGIKISNRMEETK